MDARAYWVGFNLVKGIGAVRLRALLDYFGDLSIAWQAPEEALLAAGISQKVVSNLVKIRREVDLERVCEKIQSQGIRVLIWEDTDYPARLKQVDNSPPVLYYLGELTQEDNWAIAIVGTRRVTPYGRQVAQDVAMYLAGNGITVVSGLARGVDAIAHETCLQAGGRTIAVLGSGVDRVYPPEHRQLASRIASQGAVVSDYAPGTPPDGINFPPRNRIISGLTLATIVIEAGETSGALITAKFAADQGREVFAVPGNILAAQSKGTNRLIQQGARPLVNLDDLMEILNLTRADQHRAARRTLPADPAEAAVIQVMSREPMHVDEICSKAALPIDQVSATLAMMELKGLVQRVGGMQYVAVRENQGFYGVEQ